MEKWRAVRGFTGLYSVSDLGRIWSHRKDRAMKPTPDKDGYLCVTFRDLDKHVSNHKVHRLVAKAFIPNPRRLPEVDHREMITVNCAKNLRWSSVPNNRMKRRTASASGVVGVRLCEGKRNPWQAYTGVGGRFKSLGHFLTKALATAARKEFERSL